jgi:hypothetical protein
LSKASRGRLRNRQVESSDSRDGVHGGGSLLPPPPQTAKDLGNPPRRMQAVGGGPIGFPGGREAEAVAKGRRTLKRLPETAGQEAQQRDLKVAGAAKIFSERTSTVSGALKPLFNRLP